MVNSLAWTFSLFVEDDELPLVTIVAAPDVAIAVVDTPSVRTPGGQRGSSREEGDRIEIQQVDTFHVSKAGLPLVNDCGVVDSNEVV